MRPHCNAAGVSGSRAACFREITTHLAGMKAANRVAVVAHAGKTFGGGLEELRKVLARAGHAKPLWCEVSKTSKAPKAARRLAKKGASLVFVWGGTAWFNGASTRSRGAA